MRPRTYAALLLDLDGTLVDSEPLHMLAHRRFLGTHGLTVTDSELISNIGKGDVEFYRELARNHGLALDAEAAVHGKTAELLAIFRSQPLPLRPGARLLLDHARAEGVCRCVVTSSERAVAAQALATAGLADRLPLRICREDTRVHKPDPAPYLLAAARLGVPPQRCLVVEDSVSGVRAACAAGATVIGFAGLIGAEALVAAGAVRCVRDLAALVPLATATEGTARVERQAGASR